MSESLAHRERADLCDLLLAVGPSAQTCCEGWDAEDLVAHLLVRERSLALLYMAVPGLSGLTERAMAARQRHDFADLVHTLRTPRWSPAALPAVDRAFNTVELFVHHEDVRRAQPDWEPRELASTDEDTLWKQLRMAGRALARRAGTAVVAERAHDGARGTFRGGAAPVVLTGAPSEILLLLFGRPSAGVEISGPPERVERFRGAFPRLGAS